MTRQQQIEFIREKCIAANPEIVQQGCGACKHCQAPTERPIRLADVLLAIEQAGKDGGFGMEILNGHLHFYAETYALWNLRADSLTEQSDETIDFLYQLLK